MPDLHLTSELVGDIEVIGVHGDLDLASAGALSWRLLDAIEQGRRLLVIDLTESPFIDSSGIASLLLVRKRLEEHQGRMAIVAPAPGHRRVVEIAGDDSLLGLHGATAGANPALEACRGARLRRSAGTGAL